MSGRMRQIVKGILRSMGWRLESGLWSHKSLTSGLCNLRAAIDITNGWLLEQDCPLIETS